MIARLSEAFVDGIDLLEAEGRLARLHASRLGAAAVAMCLCAMLGGVFALALAAGAVLLLAQATGLPLALLIVGGAGTAICGICGARLYRRVS